MLEAPPSFLDTVLWPEFVQINYALVEYLADITDRIIRDEEHGETEEAESGWSPWAVEILIASALDSRALSPPIRKGFGSTPGIAGDAAMKPDILLVEDVSTALAIEPLLDDGFTVHVLPETGDRDEVLARVGGRVRAIVTTTNMGADGRLIGALPRHELIANAGGRS